MASQTKRNSPRAHDHARKREEGNTLRFPPPALQPPVANGATAPEQRREDVDDDDMNDEWFTSGLSSEASADSEPSAPDSGNRRVPEARAFEDANVPGQSPTASRRRRLLAVVSLVLLSSVVLIAIALVTREQRGSSGSRSSVPSASTAPRVESVAAAKTSESRDTSVITNDAPAVSIASAQAPTVVPVARVPADEQRLTPSDQRHTFPSASETPPRRLAGTARSRPRNSSTPPFEPGIPLNQIFVNRAGDLVDQRGKPLDWKSSHAKVPDAANAIQGQSAISEDAGK